MGHTYAACAAPGFVVAAEASDGRAEPLAAPAERVGEGEDGRDSVAQQLAGWSVDIAWLLLLLPAHPMSAERPMKRMDRHNMLVSL